MLIIALVLALIGLVALVFAVVASNELVAWVCIAASFIGVVLLIIDALRERRVHADEADDEAEAIEAGADDYVDYPEELADEGPEDTDEPVEDLSDENLPEEDEEESEDEADAATEAVSGDDRAK
jgi:hypothetical protein